MFLWAFVGKGRREWAFPALLLFLSGCLVLRNVLWLAEKLYVELRSFFSLTSDDFWKIFKGHRRLKALPEQAGLSEIPGLIVAKMMTADKLPPLSEQIQTCLGAGLSKSDDDCDEWGSDFGYWADLAAFQEIKKKKKHSNLYMWCGGDNFFLVVL